MNQQALNYINMYKHSCDYCLGDVYRSCSADKYNAERKIIQSMNELRGRGYKILSNSRFYFTAGWMLNDEYLVVETVSGRKLIDIAECKFVTNQNKFNEILYAELKRNNKAELLDQIKSSDLCFSWKNWANDVIEQSQFYEFDEIKKQILHSIILGEIGYKYEHYNNFQTVISASLIYLRHKLINQALILQAIADIEEEMDVESIESAFGDEIGFLNNY